MTHPVSTLYLSIIRSRFAMLRKQARRLREAAALIADSVLSGGTLWIYDREEAISWEANVKAAGLFLTDHRFTAESTLKSGDVLLIAAVEPDTPGDVEYARKARGAGARVVAIVSAAAKDRHPHGMLLARTADIVLDNLSPEVYGLLDAKGADHPFCPATGVMNDCMFWALAAALADELLARGKTPTVYRGVHLYGGRDYNARAAQRFRELGY